MPSLSRFFFNADGQTEHRWMDMNLKVVFRSFSYASENIQTCTHYEPHHYDVLENEYTASWILKKWHYLEHEWSDSYSQYSDNTTVDGLGFDPCQGQDIFLFSKTLRVTLRPNQPPTQGIEFFFHCCTVHVVTIISPIPTHARLCMSWNRGNNDRILSMELKQPGHEGEQALPPSAVINF